MAKNTRAKRARHAAKRAGQINEEIAPIELVNEEKMENDGMLQADLMKQEAIDVVEAIDVAEDNMDVEAVASSSSSSSEPDQAVSAVKLSEFQEARQALIFEKALEIEKSGYWNAAKIKLGYKITEPSEASLETARTYVDNQYMQQSISERTAAITAELAALRENKPIPSISVEISVDDLATALHRKLHVDTYEAINSKLGMDDPLLPLVLTKQKQDRHEGVNTANLQRVVSSETHADLLESTLGEPSRFNPYQALVQKKSRDAELAALSTPAGNSHNADVAKIRRAGTIERALDNVFQTVEAVEHARVKETAKRVARPGN
jgi:hypothetical protein